MFLLEVTGGVFGEKRGLPARLLYLTALQTSQNCYKQPLPVGRYKQSRFDILWDADFVRAQIQSGVNAFCVNTLKYDILRALPLDEGAGTDYPWIRDCHLRHRAHIHRQIMQHKHLGLQWFLEHYILSYLNTEGVEYVFEAFVWARRVWRSFSSIPSECTVSPLWPDLAQPRSIRAPNTKEVNADAAADAAAACGGVFLFSRWEFDLPRGRKNEALLEERGPVFIALIAKHNLQTEPWGNWGGQAAWSIHTSSH